MKFRIKSAVAGAAALATAGALALVGAGPASAASTSPFDPAGNGATNGTISFYDASGNQITHGALDTPPAYAVANSFAGRPGDNLATLYGFVPSSTQPVSAWTGIGMSSPAAIPASGLPGALAGNTNAVASGIGFWFDAAGFPGSLPNIDANAAWQGLYQLRLYTSGPGQGVDTTVYVSATIATDVTPGEWTLVYPTPATPTTVTVPTASVASPADHGTSITLAATVAPAGTAGSVQFFDGASAVAGAVSYNAATGAATSAAFVPADGGHSFTAKFTPTSSNFAGSTSGALSYTVNPAGSIDSIGLTVTPSTGPAFTSTTLDATVNTTPAASPAGSMVFKDNGTPIGTDSSAPFTLAVNTGFAQGPHSFTATFTPSNGTVWGGPVTSLTVGATYDAPLGAAPDQQTLKVAVAPGTLTISTPWTPEHPFDLGTMVLSADGKRLTATGDFGRVASATDGVTVTDTRAGDLPWAASVTAGDFTSAGGSINSANLSFDAVVANYVSGNALNAATKPIVVNNVATSTVDGWAVADPASAGDGLNGGPHQFAVAAHGTGTVGVGGTMNLVAPTSSVAGTYTATVTFTIA